MKMNEIKWWSVQVESTDIESIKEVLKSNFPNEGKISEELQIEFARYLGVKHAILTTSGTIAIYLGLKAQGIGHGSKVGVPNLTFIATANAVKLTGAEVVLIEVDEEKYSLDFEKTRFAHNKHKLDALIPVHVSGKSAVSSELVKFAKDNDIFLLEDAAEAFGSNDPVTGQKLGTIGDVGAFSFSPNKIITSGQGGLVVTNNDSLALEIKKLKDQGRPVRGTGGADIHDSIGFNFKFTDIQAVILKSQFELIQSRIAHLKLVYEYYEKNIEKTRESQLSKFESSKGEIPLWPEFRTKYRNKLIENFRKNHIGFREIWLPLNSQKPYENDEKFEISRKISGETLWLPSSFDLSIYDLEKIVLTINEVRQ